jgi:hypothetical protein
MDEFAPCPRCRHDNPLENRFCGSCGASLMTSEQLVPRPEGSPAAAVHALPEMLGPTGRALAVGLAALALEAGLLWLHRRVERADGLSLPSAQESPEPVVPGYLISQSLEEVYVRLREGDRQGCILARTETRSFGAIGSTDV